VPRYKLSLAAAGSVVLFHVSDTLPTEAPVTRRSKDDVVGGTEPACVTVKVWPAIVIVPVRELVELLVSTVYVTVPLPPPLPPEVIVIQPALLAAGQLQPVDDDTAALPVPPALAKDWLRGEIE